MDITLETTTTKKQSFIKRLLNYLYQPLLTKMDEVKSEVDSSFDELYLKVNDLEKIINGNGNPVAGDSGLIGTLKRIRQRSAMPLLVTRDGKAINLNLAKRIWFESNYDFTTGNMRFELHCDDRKIETYEISFFDTKGLSPEVSEVIMYGISLLKKREHYSYPGSSRTYTLTEAVASKSSEHLILLATVQDNKINFYDIERICFEAFLGVVNSLKISEKEVEEITETED